MSLKIVLPLLFAAVSAIGNAMFSFGQKRAEIADNPFIFLVLALLTAICLFVITIPLFPKANSFEYLSKNYLWICLSGIGLYLTFIGFYFLYTKYGASFYILYAVLSIVSTSIIVGVLIFKESFNIYSILSVILAILTIVFFFIGQKLS